MRSCLSGEARFQFVAYAEYLMRSELSWMHERGHFEDSDSLGLYVSESWEGSQRRCIIHVRNIYRIGAKHDRSVTIEGLKDDSDIATIRYD
jgi:hypothetical protein